MFRRKKKNQDEGNGQSKEALVKKGNGCDESVAFGAHEQSVKKFFDDLGVEYDRFTKDKEEKKKNKEI